MRVLNRLPAMQARAESLMLDQFTAYAATEGTDADGFDVDTWGDRYTTLGKVSGRSRDSDTNTRTVSIGGVDRPVVEGGLHLPLDAVLPEIGWEFVCTWVDDRSDSTLLVRRWRVVDVPAKSYATARRLDVVEVP